MDSRHPTGLVEAVGIEPTSESIQQQNLHACPISFFSPQQVEETGKLTCKNAPQYVSQPSPEGSKMVEYPA